MARKSRAAPPTIAQMKKLKSTMLAKEEAYYKVSRAYNAYKNRVEQLGTGYTEEIDGVTHVISITTERYYGQDTTMTVIECKK